MFDLQEEYASLAQHLDIDWDALAGRHVLVTGATGLIGSPVSFKKLNLPTAPHA